MQDSDTQTLLARADLLVQALDPPCPTCQSNAYRVQDARRLPKGRLVATVVCQQCGYGASLMLEEDTRP